MFVMVAVLYVFYCSVLHNLQQQMAKDQAGNLESELGHSAEQVIIDILTKDEKEKTKRYFNMLLFLHKLLKWYIYWYFNCFLLSISHLLLFQFISMFVSFLLYLTNPENIVAKISKMEIFFFSFCHQTSFSSLIVVYLTFYYN